MSTINHHNVGLLRARRGWSLDRLAEEAKVNRQTIHRIEAGKIEKPRGHTVQALARALGSTVEQLCGPNLQVQSSPAPEPAGRTQINVRMSRSVRNALSIVATRYGIDASVILEAAPLLFHCVAEKSLKERQEKLDSFRGRLEELRQDGLGHLTVTGLDDWEIDASLDRESRSIRSKDLFAVEVRDDSDYRAYYGFDDDDAFIDGENNPLFNFIARLAEDVGGAEVLSFWKKWGADYEIGRDEVISLMSGSAEAAEHVLTGRAMLHELPKHLWKEDVAEARVQWVLDRGEQWWKDHPPLDIARLSFDEIEKNAARAEKENG